jgi:hypothetical protein
VATWAFILGSVGMIDRPLEIDPALHGGGLAQRWGGAIEEIRPGDVIWFPPGESMPAS